MEMVLQTDAGPGIAAWAKAVRRDWAKDEGVSEVVLERQLPIRMSPKDSHASNGAAENMVRIIEGLTRTLKIQAEENLEIKIGPSNPLLPWVVRHASFLQARFVIRQSCRTGHEEARMVKYTSPSLNLLESVIAKKSA